MDRDAPEAFEMVDLRDRYTWHRATMREWIDMRDQLVAKKENNTELRKIWRLYFQARQKAIKQLWREEGLSRKKKKPRIEGKYRKRLDIILKETFSSKHVIPDGLTKWEMEFLFESEWLDDLIYQYYQTPFRQSTIGLLFEWLITVEDEYNVAADRRQQRDDNADFVSRRSKRRLAHGENPYLPRPLELIGIYRAVLIVVETIRQDFRRAISRRGFSAESKEFHDLIVEWIEVRSGVHCSTLRHFIRQLRIRGYPTYWGVEDILGWKGWKQVLFQPRAETAKRLLAYIFKAAENTIKRDLSRSTLEREYKKYSIADEWRDYLDGSRQLRTAVIREKNWYVELSGGDPNLLRRGTVYSLPRNQS